MPKYDFPRPNLTVDIIVIKDDKILLIKRKNDPFKGQWALPGGFIEENEPPEDAACRELEEETGLKTDNLGFHKVYGQKDRDPRGWTVSIVYTYNPVDGVAKAGDDAAQLDWLDLKDLKNQKLAFDHNQIIQDYLDLK